MQQSNFSTEWLSLQNMAPCRGLQIAAAYLALKSERAELHQNL